MIYDVQFSVPVQYCIIPRGNYAAAPLQPPHCTVRNRTKIFYLHNPAVLNVKWLLLLLRFLELHLTGCYSFTMPLF